MNDMHGIYVDEKLHRTMDISHSNAHRSYDSTDSGYLTVTPSPANDTHLLRGCKTRLTSCTSSKRHHRIRTEPWQTGRILRSHSKFYSSLNDSLFESDTGESPAHLDSFNFTDPRFQDKSTSGQDYGIVLRSRTRRNYITTTPITPAFVDLSQTQPLSPTIPSSSFIASEPIEEDVEMKLVIVPQSTPQGITVHDKCSVPIIKITCCSTTRRTSPVKLMSVDNHKLSKLQITDSISTIDIKPKRLDFNQRIYPKVLDNIRATPDYTGRNTLDILTLLGEKSNHWRIISKILSYLAPQDLCSISMVSKAWKRICANDSSAHLRRLNHLILRQNAKENLKLAKKSKDIPTTPKNHHARKGFLLQVQNILNVKAQQGVPHSPPVSPSKIKFHSFLKASRSLEPWERLLPCPRCSFASRVNDENNVGTCSRMGCLMEFCTLCSSKSHVGPCKMPLLATPTKRRKELIVGSKQSRRNLRRL